jgi:holo-[acyl-carrier protein] synthase
MSTPTTAVVGEMRAGPREAIRYHPGEIDDRTSPIRIGVDLVAVSDVADSVERFGDRYVQRIFTPHEVACCRSEHGGPGGSPGYAFESLAARFAAKEATVKVLRPTGPRPDWRSIEVHRHEDGWCEIRLTGRAATLADEAGIDAWAVSLTHEASLAAAVVVGLCHGGDPAAPRPVPQPDVSSGRREE